MAYQKDAGQAALERDFILCKFNNAKRLRILSVLRQEIG
jgi:hypothetical protein